MIKFSSHQDELAPHKAVDKSGLANSRLPENSHSALLLHQLIAFISNPSWTHFQTTWQLLVPDFDHVLVLDHFSDRC